MRARYNTLKIFPTPFKGIYYIPFETERKAFYITNPYEILFRAAKLFLKGKPAYYGLRTALYLERKIWNPVSADIINESVSKRVEKPKEKKKKY